MADITQESCRDRGWQVKPPDHRPPRSRHIHLRQHQHQQCVNCPAQLWFFQRTKFGIAKKFQIFMGASRPERQRPNYCQRHTTFLPTPPQPRGNLPSRAWLPASLPSATAAAAVSIIIATRPILAAWPSMVTFQPQWWFSP